MSDEQRPPLGSMVAIDVVDLPIPPHRDGDPPYSIFDCQVRAAAIFGAFTAITTQPSEILKGTPFAKNQKPRTMLRLVFIVDPGQPLIERSFLAMPPGIALPIFHNKAAIVPTGIGVAFANGQPIALFELVVKT